MFDISKKYETVEPEFEVVDDNTIDRVKTYSAYKALVDAMAMDEITEADLTAAIETAIGYLGEVLTD